MNGPVIENVNEEKNREKITGICCFNKGNEAE